MAQPLAIEECIKKMIAMLAKKAAAMKWERCSADCEYLTFLQHICLLTQHLEEQHDFRTGQHNKEHLLTANLFLNTNA